MNKTELMKMRAMGLYPTEGSTVKELLDRIYEYLLMYCRTTEEPIKLQFIAQRFNRLAGSLGHKSMEKLLRTDSRFELTLNKKTGGFNVLPTNAKDIGPEW